MNSFSNSTSRLIISRWKRSDTQAIQQEKLSSTCKYASTEGRFSIIDKRHKESANMESSDSSSDDELDFKDKKTIFTETKFDYHVSFRSLTGTSTSSQQQPQSGLKKNKQIGGSRFKIVPVESRYERGRWACWDYYKTEEPSKPFRQRHNSPLPLFSSSSNSLSAKSFRSSCKSSLFSSIDNVPHTAPASDQKSITFSFDFSDESDIDNRLITKTSGDRKKSQQLSSSVCSISQNKAIKDLSRNDANSENKLKMNVMKSELEESEHIIPLKMLNSFGFERSLIGRYSNNRSILELLPGTMPLIGNSKISNPSEHIGHENIEISSSVDGKDKDGCIATHASIIQTYIGSTLALFQSFDSLNREPYGGL
ncbi:TSC22 domain family protein [Dirofilaria immitis]